MKEVKNHLPSEVISDILSRLPIESLMQCKCVCKSWLSLIEDDPLFVELQLTRSKNRLHRLILWERANKLHLLDRDKDQKDMWKAREIALDYTWKYGDVEKKLNFSIVGTCNGLLCMVSSFKYGCCSMFHGIFICNPITKECVMLPVGSAPCLSGDQIGFGVDSTGKYKVIHILKRRYLDVVEDHVMKVEIITLGESSWREIGIPYRPVEGMLFMNGAFYCIIQKPNTLQPFILVFDLNDEKFCTIDFPPSIQFPLYEFPPQPLYLAEFKGSLAMYHLVDRSSVIPRWFMEIDKSKGNKFYQCDPINVALTLPDIYKYFRLVGMLSNNLLLYKVVDNECYDSHLLVYCLEKKQFMCDRVCGAFPKLFGGSNFVPSLVSPIAIACGKANKDNTRSRFPGLHLEVVGYSSFWELMDSCRLHPTFNSVIFSLRCRRRYGCSNGERMRQPLNITTHMHPEPPSALNQTFTLFAIKRSVEEFASCGFLES